MADKDTYMECILKIDTSPGWQQSLTKVLTSFQAQGLAYEIIPSAGFIYVKGKTNPQIILAKIMRGGSKHATIHWINYGLPKDNNQINHFQDPFGYGTYNNGLFYPNSYYPWYNNNLLDQQFPQIGFPQRQQALENEPISETIRSSSSSSSSCSLHHHSPCPVHSRRHNHTPSPLPIRPVAADDQATNNKSGRPKHSSMKKIFSKIHVWCCKM